MAVLPSPSNTAQPQAQGFEANLDDLFLRFAVGPGRQMQINTAPLQAQAIQTSEHRRISNRSLVRFIQEQTLVVVRD